MVACGSCGSVRCCGQCRCGAGWNVKVFVDGVLKSERSGSKCCGPKRVFIYVGHEHTTQGYDGLQSFYLSIGALVDYVPNGGSFPVNFSIDNYSLVFVLFQTGAVVSELSGSVLIPWLATGQKRFVVCGEYGPPFDASSTTANSYVAAAGGSLSIPLGTQMAEGGPGGSGGCSPPYNSSMTGSSYLNSGLSTWENFFSAKVNGGTALTSASSLFSSTSGSTLSMQKTGSSEIFLSGDSNCFSGACALGAPNQAFLRRLYEFDVQ